MQVLGWTLAAAALMLVCRAGVVQVVRADSVATQANLTAAGRRRSPLPVQPATRRCEPSDRPRHDLRSQRPATRDQRARRALAAFRDQFHTFGLSPVCPDCGSARCYPLGGAAFHLIGDADRQTNWAARNTSFAEQVFDAHLKGFDDRPRFVDVRDPKDDAGRSCRETGLRRVCCRSSGTTAIPITPTCDASSARAATSI